MVKTYRKILEEGAKLLETAGTENFQFEAAELMGKALGEDCRSERYRKRLDDPSDAKLRDKFFEYCERRKKGEPLQYIIGEWEFYGITFKVGEGVLIPRQDTETVVETVIKKMSGKENLVLTDLCSGSGCIAVSLEKNLSCKKVICVEKSDKAAEYLAENIKLNNSCAEVVKGDVLDDSTAEKLPAADIIVCNPPYLTAEDMKNLQKEVSFEPETALYGGEDGLDFYRNITRIWKSKLKEGGMLAYEIGINQEDEVMRILIQHGFENVRCRTDLCGINRCVFGFLPVSTNEIGIKIDFDRINGEHE